MANLQEMKATNNAGLSEAAKRKNHPVLSKIDYLAERKELLGAGIPGSMNVEREIRTATIMLMQSKDLQESKPETFYTAVSIAINSGIGLGNGKGYLVAYKGNVSYVPGWKGIVDLVSRTGRATVWTGVARKGDHFKFGLGDSPFCEHVPGDSDEFNDITHYYAIGRVKGADWPIVEVWTAAKVSKHLKKYNKVGVKHYALKDDENFEMYGRKVALLQCVKYVPQSQDLDNAIAADAAHEAGKKATIDGNFVVINDPPESTPADNGSKDYTQQQGNGQQATYGNTSDIQPTDFNDMPSFDESGAPVEPAKQTQATQQTKNPVDVLKQRLREGTDLDTLDADADLISDTTQDLQEIEDMREIYTARRMELQDALSNRATQQQQQAPQRNANRPHATQRSTRTTPGQQSQMSMD